MAYMLRRFGFYLVAFWVSITLNFFLPRFMPGDPVSRMVARLQGQLRPDQIEALKESFGLSDAPLWEQYLRYLGQVFTGNLGFSIPLDIPGRPPPKDRDVKNVFLTGGKMHRESGGVLYGVQNQTISAIIVLNRVPVGERLFHAHLDEMKARLSDAFDLYTQLPPELEASRGTLRDPYRRPLRVVVHENPYARIQFPPEMFCGPWDERYGPLDGRVQQLYLGDEIAQLPPKR